MNRKYDSSRRRKAAEQTRQQILNAALKLHREGVTEYAALAREAGCSLATVRKHFPTKESLFRQCTRTFAESLDMPDLEALARIEAPGERLDRSVGELCRIHEAMLGYAWTGARLRDRSPALDAEMKTYEGLINAITGILAIKDPRREATARGLLDFLTYRALRLSGGLSAEAARDELITCLRPLVPGAGSDTEAKRQREDTHT